MMTCYMPPQSDLSHDSHMMCGFIITDTIKPRDYEHLNLNTRSTST